MDNENSAKELLAGNEFENSWLLSELRSAEAKNKQMDASLIEYQNRLEDSSRLLESLRYSEEHFRSVAQSAVDAIITIDKAGKIIFWNNSAESIFGYSQEEAEGSDITIIIPERLRAGHLGGVEKMVPWGAGRNGSPLESYALGRDGNEIPVEVSVSRWISQGNVYFTGIIRELTNRIRLQGEMARLDRLDLVGQLAAGIGHEIRNPMTAVRGFLQLLAKKDECVKFGDYFDLMVSELDRANTIITEFLSMVRNKQTDMQMKNINAVVMALQPLILADAIHGNKNVSVEVEEVPDILLNEKEIRQLILNLVRNGLDAMPTERTLTIKTCADGEGVLLSVQDQGYGIQPDVLEKIGTPFFTTKDNGTGIGLAVCYGIAARHNASIDIDTGSWGTLFTVRFKQGYTEVTG